MNVNIRKRKCQSTDKNDDNSDINRQKGDNGDKNKDISDTIGHVTDAN